MLSVLIINHGTAPATQACLAALADTFVFARLVFTAVAGMLAAQPVSAAGPDDEIRIGNTMPYSGPASAYGVIGKTLSAYFDKVNAEGGINGRRIRFIQNPWPTIGQCSGS